MPKPNIRVSTDDVGDYWQPRDERYFLRTVERSTWKRCRQRWWWLFVENLQPYRSANALRFGSLVHEAFAGYYIPGRKRGPHPASIFERLYNEMAAEEGTFGQYVGDEEEERKWTDALELGIAMLEHYVNHYGSDDHIEIISPEMPFQCDVPDKNGNYLTTYAGKIDAVFRNLKTGDIGLLEHKTAASINLNHLPLDEQVGSYWAFAPYVLRHLGILKEDEPLRLILYNTLRKAKPDERPANPQGHRLNKPSKDALKEAAELMELDIPKGAKVADLYDVLEKAGVDPAQLGEVSKNQPGPYFDRTPVYRTEADRKNLIYRVRAEAWEINRARRGKVPIYKNTGPGCGGGAGESKCQFYDMCVLHESDAPGWEDMKQEEYKRWDPHEDHRGAIEEGEDFDS